MRRVKFISFAILLIIYSTVGPGSSHGQAPDRRSRPVGPSATDSKPGSGGRRIALVLGNTKYIDKPLPNAENDALDMAAGEAAGDRQPRRRGRALLVTRSG